MKQQEIERRIEEETAYILMTGCTVRQCAVQFKVSKSTVHKDLVERLPELNLKAYGKVRKVLDKNWDERYIRGGLATKLKYKEVSL